MHYSDESVKQCTSAPHRHSSRLEHIDIDHMFAISQKRLTSGSTSALGQPEQSQSLFRKVS
jgi:hypothetical protein